MPNHAMSSTQRYRVQEILRDNCPVFGGRLPTEHQARVECLRLVSLAHAGKLSNEESLTLAELGLTLLEGF